MGDAVPRGSTAVMARRVEPSSTIAWPFEPLRMFGYDFVMIDPPWRWEAWGGGGEWKSANRQYDTMTIEQIAALPVGQLLRAGGVCWCWCTWPRFPLQLDVIAAWGLKYKTGGVWAKRTATGKQRIGTGYILRSVCEPFVIATIGDEHGFGDGKARNFIETIETASVDGVAREHSRKPDEVYRIIEDLTPNAWRADVFSRQPRDGWDNWGFESSKFAGRVA